MTGPCHQQTRPTKKISLRAPLKACAAARRSCHRTTAAIFRGDEYRCLHGTTSLSHAHAHGSNTAAPHLMSSCAPAIVSKNVFVLFNPRPASCHAFPISPPPRACTCAMTQLPRGPSHVPAPRTAHEGAHPRERSTRRSGSQSSAFDAPDAPYTVTSAGALPLRDNLPAMVAPQYYHHTPYPGTQALPPLLLRRRAGRTGVCAPA